MLCFTCHARIPTESKWKFFVQSHVFCSKHCLDRFNEEEARIRVKRLKEAKIEREQTKLTKKWID